MADHTDIDRLMSPDNGHIDIPKIHFVSFTAEDCTIPVDTPVGSFNDKCVRAIAFAIVSNLMHRVNEWRSEHGRPPCDLYCDDDEGPEGSDG